MSYAEMAIVAALSLLILAALVAFGIGHKRWSVVSVTAAFLVALTIPTYLYFAARLLEHEWRWSRALRKKQLELIRVRDAQAPSPDADRRGRLEPIPEMLSNQQLQRERDRWQRALTRVDNWRGRHWTKASFVPPSTDGETGTVTLTMTPFEAAPPADAGEPPMDAAEPPTDAVDPPAAPVEPAAGPPAEAGADEAAPADEAALPDEPGARPAPRPRGPAIDPGTTVYVFDDAEFAVGADGGRYLGAFVVQSVAGAADTGVQVLTVQQTAPRDAYDAKVWSRAHDSVSVYTQLPSDRWLAFSQTPASSADPEPAEDDDLPVASDRRTAPQPQKRLDQAIDALVPEPFRDDVRRHSLNAADAREPVPKADWPAIHEAIEKGDSLPGEYWAEVTFGDPADLEAYLKANPDDAIADAGLTIEMDFSAATELENKDTVTINKVFYRRPLFDGQARIHGLALPAGADGAELVADGQAALRQILEREKADLEIANARLANGLQRARAELGLLENQSAGIAADLASWRRDVDAATRLADRFEEEAKSATARLRRTEQEVIKLGRELVEDVGRAVREIDQAAPPPADRGAAAF